jgi:hypothetical protein
MLKVKEIKELIRQAKLSGAACVEYESVEERLVISFHGDVAKGTCCETGRKSQEQPPASPLMEEPTPIDRLFRGFSVGRENGGAP